MKNLLVERVVATPQPTLVDLISLDETAKPPLGSVLLRTLPELLGLLEAETDRLWEAFDTRVVEDLALTPLTLLAMRRPYLSVDDGLELLLSTPIGYLQSLFLSDQSFDEFLLAALTEISVRIGRDVRPSADSLSSQPFMPGVANEFGALPLTVIPETDLLRSCIADDDLRDVGSFSAVSESTLFQAAGFGALPLRVMRMCWALGNELAWLASLAGTRDENELPRSLYAEVHRALAAGLSHRPGHQRAIHVILRRLGLQGGNPMTLEELGRTLNVTRERIRQIEAKSVKALDITGFMTELVPLRMDIFFTLAAHGWGMLTIDLARELAASREWSDVPSIEALKSVTAMLPECIADTTGEVVLLTGAGCFECDALAGVLDEIRTEGSAVPVSELLTRLVRAAAHARPECTRCAEHDPKVFAALLEIALNRQIDFVRKSDGWLLPQSQAGRRPSSLAFRAKEALRRSGRCMHFTEVATLLATDDPGRSPVSQRNVYAALDRDPGVVSWDTGSFIHKECMPFPYQVVRSVEEWIIERFMSPAAPPMLSVHGVYQRFEQDCVSHDVPSELALYSLLRLSSEPSLAYPKYPQIYWQSGFEHRLPLGLVLDDFVRDAGGVVSMDELRGFVVHEMGFKEFQLTQALGLLPSVLRTANGAYLHIDYAHVPKKVLDKIARHAETLVHQEGHVSVQRVFDDLKVDCVVNGVESPEMLFSLLQLEERDDLVANRFPMLVHREDNEASALTILASIAAYLAEKGAPFSSAELEEEFVEKRGYRERTVHLAWLRGTCQAE